MNGERAFPNTSQSIAWACRYALENVEGITPELADRVSLMVSELATNAVRHAASSFTVSIERDAGSIRVAVTDAGHGTPLVKSPAPTDYSGRGLLIVRTLADSWGVTETSGGSGKTVWFVLDLDAQTSAISGGRGSRDTEEPPENPEPITGSARSMRCRADHAEGRRHAQYGHSRLAAAALRPYAGIDRRAAAHDGRSAPEGQSRRGRDRSATDRTRDRRPRGTVGAGARSRWIRHVALGKGDRSRQWDTKLEELYGLQPGSFDGTFDAYVALLHPEDVAGTLATVAEAVEAKSSYVVEHRVVWPDGSVRWLQGKGRVTLDEAGEVTGTIGCTADVTDQMMLVFEQDRSHAVAVAAAELERCEPGTAAVPR